MNKKAIIPVIIVAAVAALYFLGKSRLTRIKVLFRGFNVTGGLLRPKFNLKFGLQNPTNETATLNSLVGEVTANGKIIANVSSFIPTKINANQESIFSVVAEPLGISIAATVMNFIKTKNKLQIKFTGSANVDNIVYPLAENLTI